MNEVISREVARRLRQIARLQLKWANGLRAARDGRILAERFANTDQRRT